MEQALKPNPNKQSEGGRICKGAKHEGILAFSFWPDKALPLEKQGLREKWKDSAD
jgi:hypothetical protein